MRPSVFLAMLVALLFASAAIAQIHDQPQKQGTVSTKAIERHAGKTQRKLVLPDIAALTKKAWKADMKVLASQQRKSATVLSFFNGRGKWLLATRHAKCWEVPWQRSCTVARASHRLHTELLRVSTRRLIYEIPNTRNWTRAMRYAQRAFPGTYDWLAAISNRECRACYTTTAFICNYQGSGACGPMQFMAGTFYGHQDDARAYLKAQGFIVADEVWQWDNQLGQALTAAFMRYTHIDGCHWCLR